MGAESEAAADLAARECNLVLSIHADCCEVLREVHMPDDRLSAAAEKASSMIRAAAEPFRLGVIGSFRVGKSTLVNALIGLGREIAFTDAEEATALESQYSWAPDYAAILHHTDGTQEEHSIEALNELLRNRRHDSEWLSGISRAQYLCPSPWLREFELWDAPGFSGSHGNQEVAVRYAESLGGAIWVFDSTTLGSAVIAPAIESLRSMGKKAVAILNRIDQFDEDPQAAIDYVLEAYPGVFARVLPLSALQEFQAVTDRREESLALAALRREIANTLAGGGESGKVERIRAAASVAGRQFAQEIRLHRLALSDRLGLLAHERMQLEQAAQRILEDLPALTKRHAEDVVVQELEIKGFGILDRAMQGQDDLDDRALDEDSWSTSFGEKLRGAMKQLGLGDPDSMLGGMIDATTQKRRRLVARVRVLSMLADPALSQILGQKVLTNIEQDLNARWKLESREALRTAALAVPSVGLEDIQKKHDPDEKRFGEAVEAGTAASVISIAGLGLLAALSAAVTWPVTLLAVPIGLARGWFSHDAAMKTDLQDDEKARTDVRIYLQEAAERITAHLEKEIPPVLRRDTTAQIERYLQQHRALLLPQAVDDLRISECIQVLSSHEIQLNPAQASEDSATDVRGLRRSLGERIPRIDIFLPAAPGSMAEFLSEIPADCQVRLLFANPECSARELQEQEARIWGDWPGVRSCRALLMRGSEPCRLEPLIIFADRCLTAGESPGSFQQLDQVLYPWPLGLSAAQRRFSEWWDGRTAAHGTLDVVTL